MYTILRLPVIISIWKRFEYDGGSKARNFLLKELGVGKTDIIENKRTISDLLFKCVNTRTGFIKLYDTIG